MNNNIKLFDTFYNKGVGECVLLATKGDKFLAGIKEKAKSEFCHFVVASYLQNNGSWGWGHYFSNLAEASNYLYENTLYNEIKERYSSLNNLTKRLQEDYEGTIPFEQDEQDRLDLCYILDLFDTIKNNIEGE